MSILRPYVIALTIVLIDQISKWMVKSWMIIHDSIPLIGSTIQLTYIENPGMAFGIRFFESHPFWGRWFFSVVSIVASIGLVWYIYQARKETILYRTSLGLILGGAVGNLIDRVLFGRVVDFMDVDIPDVFGMHRWPVFNVADSAVVVGMIIMTFFVIFHKPGDQEGQIPLESETAANPGSGSE